MDSPSEILSNFELVKKSYNLEFLNELPFDQYLCPECKEVPEFINIDYDKDYEIELACKAHGEQKLPIETYFKKESDYLYINEICGKDKKTIQKNYKKCLFDYCPGCNIFLCGACGLNHKHQTHFYKVNEMNSICLKHFKKYNKYCIDCQKHFCSEDEICTGHEIKEFKKPNSKDIETLLNEKEILLKEKELIEYLIKLINTILQTYREHPNNYFHNINIDHLADIITTNRRNKNEREKLLSKIDNLEKIALHYLNIKFKMDLTGNEVIIDLNGKNICNMDFALLSEISFKNAEYIKLRNNDISDIKPLGKLKYPKLKVLDLSYNKIEDISPFEEYSKNEQKIETILLNNNKISNADIFKKKIFPFMKDINLDENKLLQKDIQEIKDIIKGKKPQIKKIIKSPLNDKDYILMTNITKKMKDNNGGYIPMGKLPKLPKVEENKRYNNNPMKTFRKSNSMIDVNIINNKSNFNIKSNDFKKINYIKIN